MGEQDAAADAVLATLLGWLAENGVQIDFDQVQIVKDGVCHGYGIRAVREVAEHACVCTIPKQAVLSVRTSPIAAELEAEGIHGGLGECEALHVVHSIHIYTAL